MEKGHSWIYNVHLTIFLLIELIISAPNINMWQMHLPCITVLLTAVYENKLKIEFI